MPVNIETIKEGDRKFLAAPEVRAKVGRNLESTFPKPGQKVSCHYVLTLENGKKIDSSRDRGQPFSFTIGKGEVIKGWDEGVAKMSVGQRAKLTISSDMGYGAKGVPGTIPGGATLLFDVELLGVK